MPKHAAHGHDLALVVKGMGQDVMKDERGSPNRNVSIGKSKLRIAVQLLIGEA